MKTLAYILLSALLLAGASCNRFEAKHSQLPEEEQQDLKDKTDVRQQDTLPVLTRDSLVR